MTHQQASSHQPRGPISYLYRGETDSGIVVVISRKIWIGSRWVGVVLTLTQYPNTIIVSNNQHNMLRRCSRVHSLLSIITATGNTVYMLNTDFLTLHGTSSGIHCHTATVVLGLKSLISQSLASYVTWHM